MNPARSLSGSNHCAEQLEAVWRFIVRRVFPLSVAWVVGTGVAVAANWSKRLGQGPTPERWSAVPAVDAKNAVFISSSRGTVVALDGTTGVEIWRRRIGEFASLSLLIAKESTVVVGGISGNDSVLFGLDVTDGRTLWRQVVGGTSMAIPGAATPDGFVFVSTLDRVMAVRAEDGSRLWSTSLSVALGDRGVSIDGASMAVGFGLVVVSDHVGGSEDPNTLLALDFDTGSLRWTLPNAFSGGAVPLASGHFLVGYSRILGCWPEGFMRISTSGESQIITGASSHDCMVPETAFSVMSDSLCLAGSGLHGFHKAIQGRSLVTLMSVPGIGYSMGQPTLTADGTLYDIRAARDMGGNNANWLTACSSPDWSRTVPHLLNQTQLVGTPSAPVVTPSGMVVVVSPDTGDVVGLEGTAPLAATHWPKARGDRANSACEPSFHVGPPRGEWRSVSGTFPSGKPFLLEATIPGARPIRVDWYRNGNLLGKTTNGQWRVPAVSASDTGDYTFVAANAHGSFTSSPVHVEMAFAVMARVEGGGSVRKDVAANRFPYGSKVRFEAIPQANSRFLGWSGDLTGDHLVQEAVITGDLQFVARFTSVARTLKYARDLGELDTRSDRVPAVGLNGVIYHTHGGGLFALESSTGDVLWHFEDPAILRSTNGIYPVVLDNGAILLSAPGELLCIDPGTHAQKWRVATSGRVWVGELGGIMEYAEPNGQRDSGILKIRDPENGSLLWEGTGLALLTLPAHLISRDELLRMQVPGTTPASSTLFVGWQSLGVLAGWNAATGDLNWLAPPINTPGTFAEPIIGEDGFIYALTHSDRLHALNERDHRFIWVKQFGAQVHAQPTLARDHTLYLTVGNELVGVDAVAGSVIWSHAFSDAFGQPYTTPRTAATIDGAGIAYVGTDHGIAAVVVDSLLAESPWPKVNGNAQNSGRRKRHAPIFYGQPQGPTLVNRGTGSLRVGVTGNPAPEFQWYLDGRPILNATNSEVDLAKTGLAHGGSLTVIARNDLGSSESAPIYLFGEDQVPAQIMSLTLKVSGRTTVQIDRAASVDGPWTIVDTLNDVAGPHVWNDFESPASGTQFYHCRSSTPIQVQPELLNAFRVEAAVGVSRAIEFVDAQGGWTNWQHLTNVTIQTSPMWILDPTPNPPKPRYYRVVPR